MAASSVCASCLRVLRQQTRAHHPPPPRSPLRIPQRQHTLAPSPRALTTSTRHLAQQPQTQTPTPPPPPPAAFASLATTLRASTTPLLRATTEPYAAYGSTELLFQSCATQCSYSIPSLLLTPPVPAPKNAGGEDIGVGEGRWVTPKSQGGLGLEVTFNSWAQVVMLHMYLLTVRLRGFPAEHVGVWHQNLLDHFFYAAEDRMAVYHGMVARSVRNKYLKDLWLQWRGLLLSYDEGLVRGDAVLGAAVWRNVFRAGEGEGVVGDVGAVVGYMRRELGRLGEIGDGEIAEGKVGFGKLEVKGLARESPWMRKSFTAEDLKEVEVRQ
ncbi:hypothetical protein B0A54_04473 [Friedmanniomyces endolithicus]|uniref:Ubiquinol-cytochrome c chaperone domain-containing protein n=1 Tax=Friedmanniomyces endolithicus TaxID=329885 RepID=A0A4U0V980_9PEZI|nr:hypothetical protein B0A54_04473 [Friedmanniomyces endolithicus]